MSQYDLKIVGQVKQDEYVSLKSYIDILSVDDKLTVTIEDSKEKSASEFSKILEQNGLIKISNDKCGNNAYKMTYKRKK